MSLHDPWYVRNVDVYAAHYLAGSWWKPFHVLVEVQQILRRADWGTCYTTYKNNAIYRASNSSLEGHHMCWLMSPFKTGCWKRSHVVFLRLWSHHNAQTKFQWHIHARLATTLQCQGPINHLSWMSHMAVWRYMTQILCGTDLFEELATSFSTSHRSFPSLTTHYSTFTDLGPGRRKRIALLHYRLQPFKTRSVHVGFIYLAVMTAFMGYTPEPVWSQDGENPKINFVNTTIVCVILA